MSFYKDNPAQYTICILSLRSNPLPFEKDHFGKNSKPSSLTPKSSEKTILQKPTITYLFLLGRTPALTPFSTSKPESAYKCSISDSHNRAHCQILQEELLLGHTVPRGEDDVMKALLTEAEDSGKAGNEPSECSDTLGGKAEGAEDVSFQMAYTIYNTNNSYNDNDNNNYHDNGSNWTAYMGSSRYCAP